MEWRWHAGGGAALKTLMGFNVSPSPIIGNSCRVLLVHLQKSTRNREKGAQFQGHLRLDIGVYYFPL